MELWYWKQYWKEKGEASDALKRAGFTWGIGVELYNSPFIWIPAEKIHSKYDKFRVEKIKINEETKDIEGLSIKNDKGERVYVFNK